MTGDERFELPQLVSIGDEGRDVLVDERTGTAAVGWTAADYDELLALFAERFGPPPLPANEHLRSS